MGMGKWIVDVTSFQKIFDLCNIIQWREVEMLPIRERWLDGRTNNNKGRLCYSAFDLGNPESHNNDKGAGVC